MNLKTVFGGRRQKTDSFPIFHIAMLPMYIFLQRKMRVRIEFSDMVT